MDTNLCYKTYSWMGKVYTRFWIFAPIKRRFHQYICVQWQNRDNNQAQFVYAHI